MKQLIFIIHIQIVLSLSICGQENKRNKYSPIDFVQLMRNLNVDTSGIIQTKTWYKGVGNETGNAYIYMIHKNGGKWWLSNTKKRFPSHVEDSVQMFAEDYALKCLLKQDRALLKNFNKWAFFIDKKDLKGKPVVLGGDLIRVDEKGNYSLPSEAEIKKMEAQLDYHPKYPHTVILYEQQAGNNQWIEIDRKEFKTEEEKNKSTWESNFINQKLKESNETNPQK